MARSRSPSRKRSPGPGKRWAEWALVRGWVALLSLVADWLAAAPAGPVRDHWLRHVTRDLGKLEQILRCLLLIMRPPRAAPKAEPLVIARSGNPRAARARRGRPRFSVTLRNFSWYTPVPKPPAPSACGPSAQPRPAPEDPAAVLQRRFAAMRDVFANPGPHAARIAAACLARGLRPRRPKAVFPTPDLRIPGRVAAPARPHLHAPAHLDTS